MIPVRQAIVLWDRNSKKVMIKPVGMQDTPEMAELSRSGGAAWGFWQEAPIDELYFRMLQQLWGMVRDDGIPFETAHEAFLIIPEYRVTLPPCDDEYNSEKHGPVERPEGWSEGYPL